MKFSTFGAAAVSLACVACGQSEIEAPITALAPNIVLIVADDLGVNDIGLNGAEYARTPNIASLARDGVQFANAYATSPVCSTSRAALLTGVYQQRFGMESNPSPRALAARIAADEPGAEMGPPFPDEPPQAERGLPPEVVTIAEYLQAEGYRTGLVGKWHLGSAEGYRPQDQGFEYFLGFLGGASLFAEREDETVTGASLPWNGLDNFLWERLGYSLEENGEPNAERGYQTYVFADAASAFIRRNDTRPFFLTVAFNAPHNPLQAPSELVEARGSEEPLRRRVYHAMVDALDEGIGQVLAALDENGRARDTIVIFTSDNGGAGYVRLPEVNLPYRGFKASLWEGGIRVPLLIRGPGFRAGDTEPAVVALHDLVPTLLRRVNPAIELSGFDGRDLAQRAENPEPIFWKNNELWAVRSGDWKLIFDERQGRGWLYELANDPLEQNNLIQVYPERADALTAQYRAFEASLPDRPLWAPSFFTPINADPVLDDAPSGPDWVMWPG